MGLRKGLVKRVLVIRRLVKRGSLWIMFQNAVTPSPVWILLQLHLCSHL